MAAILTSGISVNPGFVKGTAKIINNMADLNEIEYGDIIILPNSDPVYAVAVMKAAAVICEVGGKFSHICMIAVEMGIPCVTGVTDAMAKISGGQLISVNANEGVIYSHE